MEVLIIGAGATGLLLAQGLKKANISFQVFERETPDFYQNRQREWGMSLHWGTEPVKIVLPPDLHARIKEAANDPWYEPPEGDVFRLPQHAGNTGELLNEVPFPPGSLRVNRRKFRKLLREGIQINYGKRLQAIEKSDTGVTAIFEDGSRATGSIMIGCDGSNSKVRELLVGVEKSRKQSSGVNMINFTTKFDVETSKMLKNRFPICFNTYHPKNIMFWTSVQDVGDPENPDTWTFQPIFSWMGSPSKEELSTQEARTAFIKSWAPDYAPFWQNVLNAIPDDAQFGIDQIAYWTPIDWSAEPLAARVSLAGDAAHAMPPFRGQGLNNALEDAATLTKLLTDIGSTSTPEAQTSALREYETEMIPRSTKEINISRTAARLAHDYENLMENPLFKFGIKKGAGEDAQPKLPVINGLAVAGAESNGT